MYLILRIWMPEDLIWLHFLAGLGITVVREAILIYALINIFNIIKHLPTDRQRKDLTAGRRSLKFGGYVPFDFIKMLPETPCWENNSQKPTHLGVEACKIINIRERSRSLYYIMIHTTFPNLLHSCTYVVVIYLFIIRQGILL